MKKLNKLFAILFAVLGVGTLSAQTWTAPVVGVDLSDVNDNTELYMYNVKADAFACSGMSYGTHAVVKELHNGDSKLSSDVHRCRVSKPGDGQVQIRLNERTWLGGGGATSTNECWVDYGSNNVYAYNEVSDNVYTLKPTTATNDSYLDCSWAYGGHITFSATNGYGNTEWAFVLRSDITNGKYLLYKTKKEMYDIYTAVVAAGHESTYATALATANAAYVASDATAASVNAATKVLLKEVAPVLSSGNFAANSLFNNPDMRGYGDDTDWGNGLNAFANGTFESWHSAETITQTQTGLPNGFYTVVFLGMYRQDGSDAAPTLTLTSGNNSAKANLKATSEIDFGSIVSPGKNANNAEDWKSNKPNNTYGAGEALAHTDAGVKIENFLVENGELTVTVAMPSKSQWLLCQGFQIFYKAESLDDFANLFYDAKDAAEAIDQTTINTYAKNQLSAALANAANEQVNKAWYVEQTEQLQDAITLANDIVTPYASLNALIELCTTYAEESYSNVATESVRTTFTTAITTATNNGDAATTVAALNNAYSTLEVARQEYVKEAIPTTGNSFDMTFMMTNPQVASATGWTNGGTANGQQYTGAPDNTYLDFYQVTRDMNQTLAALPNGSYYAKAATRGHSDVTVGYIYVKNGDNKVTKDIHKVGNKDNTLGNGWGWTTTESVAVANGQLTIGFYGECATNQWVGADVFTLYRSFDVTAMQSSLSGLLEEAKAIVTASKPMNATVEATLSSTIDATDVEATDPVEIDNMITALNEAITNAENSIAAYEAIPAYITKANTIDESIAAEYQTAYDNRTLAKSAETVFQELEVATYNYVTENFEYPVPLSDEWKSDGTHTHAATFYDEHWSGEKRAYKNQHDGWGDPKEGYPADSWSIDFEQEVTLPAGEYVFKVAGRKSVDATLELVVTMGETELGTVNDFPNSNAGFGINKAGAASFDANDPAGFAVLTNDKGEVTRTGFGWQWRYVKFALADKATVKVAVHAETSKIYNWVSFGDYTLQMTEETYLNANKPNMDAISATASALVDTKPMGDDENTALKDALAMTYTTGAQMLAKMNALETAIDNANAWRSTYNTEKGKLVAALERFEADYNDAENGALDYMNKERWATVIAKAQAAAVVKDNLTSHAILTTATTELTAALDAATVSVGEYAALKAAITEANAHYNGGNWGDGAFQRPTSAKESLNTTSAQATYDAATADGEGVTSVTKTLNDAIGAIVLNAPVEGTCYKIVMGDLTWTNNNNATMLATKDKSLVFVKGGQSEAQGLYSINFTGKNDNYAHALSFNAVKDATNQYTISFVDNDGATRYICDGSVTGAGTGTYGIRTTTDAAKALPVEVRATATDGVWNLYNTVAKELLGAQDAGLYTTTRNNNLKIMEAPKHEVTLALSEVGWATLMLPFDAELPEGVIAYSCTGTEGEVLTLTEAESLKANTPYLMNGEKSTHTFTGYGLASKDSYTDGLFVGTYVDYQTTADGKTYVLQNNNGNLAFYLVQETAHPWIRTNRCYMIYEAANGAPVFRIGKGTTGIAPSTLNAQPSTVIYDLMGRKVTTMMKGGMYIVNGKKVVIR